MKKILRGARLIAMGFTILVVAALALDRGGFLNVDDVLKVGRGSQVARAAQGSCVMPTVGTVSGLTLVQDINTCFTAILTANSGGTAPANGAGGVPQTGQMWLDTSTTPNGLKIYDGTVWQVVGYLDAATGRWTPPVGGGTNTLASAGTTDLWSIRQAYLAVSGTTSITALASASAIPGTLKVVQFTGSLTLTYNATSLILPSGANIQTAAGDYALVLALTSTNVAVVSYSRASGQAVVNPSVPVGTILSFSGFTLPDANYLFGDGSAPLRATYPALLAANTSAQTGTRTSGSAIVTALSDTSQLVAGTAIEGTGIPAATTILTVDSATQVTMSANATSSGSNTLTFFPYGAGNGTTTFNLPDCRGRYLAGRDNMTSAASRLTVTYLGKAARLGATGGAESKVIAQANLPNVSLDAQIPAGAGSHLHGGGDLFDAESHVGAFAITGAATAVTAVNNSGGGNTAAATLPQLDGFTSTLSGGTPQINMGIVPPTLVVNCIVRVL